MNLYKFATFRHRHERGTSAMASTNERGTRDNAEMSGTCAEPSATNKTWKKQKKTGGTEQEETEGKGKERKEKETKGKEGKGKEREEHERGTRANAEMSAEPTLNQRWQKRKAKERWRIRIKDKVRNGTDNQRKDSRGKYRRRTRTGTIMSAEPAEPALNQEQGKKRKRNEAKESKRNQRQGKESKRTQRKRKVIREQKGNTWKEKRRKDWRGTGANLGQTCETESASNVSAAYLRF